MMRDEHTTTKKHQNEHTRHTRHLGIKKICQNREKEGFFYGRLIACQSSWRKKEVQKTKKSQSNEQLFFLCEIFFPCVFKLLEADPPSSFWKIRRNALPFSPATEKPTFLTLISTAALYPLRLKIPEGLL